MAPEMALVSAPKMHFQWCYKWCLNGAGMAPEMALVAAPKINFQWRFNGVFEAPDWRLKIGALTVPLEHLKMASFERL